MDGRDWNLFLFPYEQAVEELKVKFKTLRGELKTREAYSPIEFVTGRVKKISSVFEKAKRLNVPMDRIETGIEDIAGIRIMCQFVEDIQTVAESIRKRKDLLLVYEKDYITNYKESGYRSFHMIVEYPVQTALGLKRVLAEIQLRTLAMNFWATIEHSLNYKYKESLPEDVRDRLKKAAEAAFQLDTEMSSIRQEIVDAQRGFEESSNVVSKVLSGIQDLYFFHRVREAAQYQLRFNELWEQEDIWGLKQLADDIQASIARAKRGGNA
ncbi:GTP pyrophosphokinase [Paenibacillus darwinianus]|uniref:GTP diphosphokinase n=1 Tax=Paenibacillus darwinianus TaxID=1380763 RepID=A0A9W5W6M7_9BACL|nr:GTP pyrophosphokinase family protein [Paenibacillus darwinianus]EXX86988.1 GTP pyrophosphokinase [Paenibacillus darwinianus]EXX87184.1 GTP pyrophosphokinase [Paenibacillus darwinianus]EXX87222.1 GTP pyrophosphokinase [Paenibacillus darwinianus]